MNSETIPKAGDLVMFNKSVVSELLEDEAFNWETWVGIVFCVHNCDDCSVMWHDGIARREFCDYLEVVCECR